MKYIMIVVVGLLVLSGAYLAYTWNEERKQQESEQESKRAPENPLVVRSVSGNEIVIELADNKEGRELHKALQKEESGAILWRCLGAENKKENGITVVHTSLTLGGPVAWNGDEPGVFTDNMRSMHVPANLCNVQTALGAYNLKPVNGVAIKDPRWATFVRTYLTELFRHGYGAIFPGGDVNTVNIHPVPTKTQVEKLQGFEVGSGIQCLTEEGKATTGYKVRAAKTPKDIPGECEMLVYNNGKRTIWSLRGPEADKLVIRHEF